MHTTSYWLTIPASVMALLPYAADDRRDGVVGLAFALKQVAQLLLMCDGHDIGISIDTGDGDGLGSRRRRQPAEDLRLRQLSGRHRVQRAAVSDARRAADEHAHADCRVPVRERLPGMCRADRQHRAAREGCCASDPRSVARGHQRTQRKQRTQRRSRRRSNRFEHAGRSHPRDRQTRGASGIPRRSTSLPDPPDLPAHSTYQTHATYPTHLPLQIARRSGGEWRDGCFVVDRRVEPSARHGSESGRRCSAERLERGVGRCGALHERGAGAGRRSSSSTSKPPGSAAAQGRWRSSSAAAGSTPDGAFVTRQFLLTRFATSGRCSRRSPPNWDAPARSSASTASRSTRRCSRRAFCFTGWNGSAGGCRMSTCCTRRGGSGRPVARPFHGSSAGDSRELRRTTLTPARSAPRAGDCRRAARRRRARLRDPRPLLPVRPLGRCRSAQGGPRAQSPRSADAGGADRAAPAPDADRAGRRSRRARSARARPRLRTGGVSTIARAPPFATRSTAAARRAAPTIRSESMRCGCWRSRGAARGGYEEAASCWCDLLAIRGCPPQLEREATAALAIHHEHRRRDLELGEGVCVAESGKRDATGLEGSRAAPAGAAGQEDGLAKSEV